MRFFLAIFSSFKLLIDILLLKNEIIKIMKKRLQKGLLALTLLGLVASCSTTNDVASNRGIQKRKYTKGYFIDFNQNKGGNAHDNDNIAKSESTPVEEVTLAQEMPFVRSIEQEVEYVEEVQTLPTVVTTIEAYDVEATAINSTVSTPNSSVAQNVEIEAVQEITFPSKLTKNDRKSIKRQASLENKTSEDAILYYILAFFIPFLAVGLVTDWDVKQVIINILLTMLCGIPGVIHAFIVVSRNV